MNGNECVIDRKLESVVEKGQAEVGVSGDVIVERKDRVSVMELDSRASDCEGRARVLEHERSEYVRGRTCEGSDSSIATEVESRALGSKEAQNDQFDHLNNEMEEQSARFDARDEQKDGIASQADINVEVDRYTVPKYNSLLSEFDDYVANEKHGEIMARSRALSYGFELGDMVWGKVKSHPWWPGHIFNEVFASPSVRRTRRDGHVLVAFFGDSSYGWFDPAELIPFDANFAEKSQQTNSRNFVKAVEEAVDEVSRRRGLGLTCRCRNPYNFRATGAQGYFAVDVPEYEPGGVYSENQITKVRNGFRPGETLSFVKELALAPQSSVQKSIDFVKNMATVFSFRKAVFEEFDETYAQAFGVQPSRPSHNNVNALDHVKEPPRAPLSGPLVIAEALGGGKSSKKPTKVKDNSKKDRYLFKRRDEPSDPGTLQISQGQTGSLGPSPYMERSTTFATEDYVLQKRTPVPQIPYKQEQTGFISRDGAVYGRDVSSKEPVTIDQASVYSGSLDIQGSAVDAKASLDKEKGVLQETKVREGPDVVVEPTSSSWSDLSAKAEYPRVADGTPPSIRREGEAMADFKPEESANMSRSHEGFPPMELSFAARAEKGHGLAQAQDGQTGAHPSPIGAKLSDGKSAHGGVKKVKVLKRSLGNLGLENSTTEEKKKKKKKKEISSETSPDHPQKKHMKIVRVGAAVGNSAAKSGHISLASKEDSKINHLKKEIVPSNSFFSSVGTLPIAGVGNIEIELPQLLSDLHALALDPFHAVERNGPKIIGQFFLRFRSLVYQKSLVLSPPSETQTMEVRATKPPIVGVAENSAGENVRDSAHPKPVKSLVRPDDPTKAGRKRVPSDRQEEIAAKRLKKISQLKSLTSEKKTSQRTLEAQRVEGKEQAAAVPVKPLKTDSVKKMDPPIRAVEPTMLVMRFPPKTSLPSGAELKARFARFGSIDQSAIRVFWKTSTCRVVFRHKLDAQAAFKYANGNSALFGNVSVKYHLREVGAPASEVPESDKGRGDDTPAQTPRVKEPMVERAAPGISHQPLLQSAVQLKSILKKPTGDEAGQVAGGNGGRGTPRVKFMLGGEETSRGEQLMVGNRNIFNNNASFADSGGAPPSVAMDFNSKNFQKVISSSSSSPPIHPLPSQFTKASVNNLHYSEIPPRNLYNLNPPPMGGPPSAAIIDISQQMLSLLTRCNDVVNSVTGLLGYVPYHPL